MAMISLFSVTHSFDKKNTITEKIKNNIYISSLYTLLFILVSLGISLILYPEQVIILFVFISTYFLIISIILAISFFFIFTIFFGFKFELFLLFFLQLFLPVVVLYYFNLNIQDLSTFWKNYFYSTLTLGEDENTDNFSIHNNTNTNKTEGILFSTGENTLNPASSSETPSSENNPASSSETPSSEVTPFEVNDQDLEQFVSIASGGELYSETVKAEALKSVETELFLRKETADDALLAGYKDSDGAFPEYSEASENFNKGVEIAKPVHPLLPKELTEPHAEGFEYNKDREKE
jgi:hypothetical protein